MMDSNDWNSTTQADKVEFVKPEPVGPNAKQMRNGLSHERHPEDF